MILWLAELTLQRMSNSQPSTDIFHTEMTNGLMRRKRHKCFLENKHLLNDSVAGWAFELVATRLSKTAFVVLKVAFPTGMINRLRTPRKGPAYGKFTPLMA